MMNIALGFDCNFAAYAATTIKSILLHNKNVKFYLMHDNLKDSDIKKISSIIDSHNENYEWIDMSNEFNNLFTGNWKSKTLYFPIKLPTVCKDERILFLDADTFVLGDLSEFYNQNLDSYYLAAANDYGMLSDLKSNNILNLGDKALAIQEYFNNELGWDENEMLKYFNSGMLLMNLKLMRENKVEEQMIESLKHKIFAFPDQDCINYTCHNHVKIVEPKYNFMVIFKSTWKRLDDKYKQNVQAYRTEKERPLIIHYLLKPWRKPNGKLPFAKEYNRVKAMTPYKHHYSKQELLSFSWLFNF